MASEHVCSLCGRSSPSAVCAWCGMVSDIGVAIEEAAELVRAAGRGSGRSGTPGILRGAPPAGVAAALEPRVIVPDPEALEPPAGMCSIPAGIFMFGESRQPRYLADYFMDRYPVTNQEFAEFVAATGHRPPRFWSGRKAPPGKADHPVVGVTFEDALAFARWAGKDLPTEEEWEKAARGADGRFYPWGDLFSAEKSNVSGTGIKDTSSVRQFEAHASPFGCVDMAGNVWEWTKSEYQPGGSNRALKGGSWYDFSTYARCASRFSAPAEYEGNSVGFRCVHRPGQGGPTPPRPRQIPTASEAGEAPVRPATPRRPPEHDAPGPAGLLRNLVETTVGAFDDFNLAAAQARVAEILDVPVAIPEPAATFEVPLGAAEMDLTALPGNWGRRLEPAARALRWLMAHGYRLGRAIDAFFRRAPRWLAVLAILGIPGATIGLVLLASDREAPVLGADAPRPPRPTSQVTTRSKRSRRAEVPPPFAVGLEVAREDAADATFREAIPAAPPGMVYVPAGEAIVGRENRKVVLPGFFVDAYEVTNLEYQRFVAATGYPPPAHWTEGSVPPGLERHPVTNVDFAAARAYAAWAGKRLPTEEEWEAAARGPEGWRFPWGSEPDSCRANLFQPAAQMMGTREVGTLPAGMSPHGCHDMAGNVLEWTATRHGENYVLKGGSWGLSREHGACHFRYVFFPPETRTPMVGLRCVKDVAEDGTANAKERRP